MAKDCHTSLNAPKGNTRIHTEASELRLWWMAFNMYHLRIMRVYIDISYLKFRRDNRLAIFLHNASSCTWLGRCCSLSSSISRNLSKFNITTWKPRGDVHHLLIFWKCTFHKNEANSRRFHPNSQKLEQFQTDESWPTRDLEAVNIHFGALK